MLSRFGHISKMREAVEVSKNFQKVLEKAHEMAEVRRRMKNKIVEMEG